MVGEAYLGLGSNLGDRRANICEGLAALGDISTGVTSSAIYETCPAGFSIQPPFLNAACRILTWLDPFELLSHVGSIEAAVGRERSVPNGPRSLDIDILVYGRLVLDMPGLRIPHPRMVQREFVLLPLSEIAPQLEHPVLGETVSSLLAKLSREQEIAAQTVRGGRLRYCDSHQ